MRHEKEETMPMRCTVDKIVPKRSVVEKSVLMRGIGHRVVTHPSSSGRPLKRHGVSEEEESEDEDDNQWAMIIRGSVTEFEK